MYEEGPWNLASLVSAKDGWMSDAECAALAGFAVLLDADHRLTGIRTDDLRALEIGCYKGRATSALVQVFDKVTVIDTFQGPQERPTEGGVREAFDENMATLAETIALAAGHVRVMAQRSEEALAWLGEGAERFDLVLVDGDHRVEAVARDLELAWPLVEERGYLFVDDVNWTTVADGVLKWCERMWPAGGSLTMHRVTAKLAFVRKIQGNPV